MNLREGIVERMDRIQKLFMKVQYAMQDVMPLPEIIQQLDAEPGDFRSVAYESASMRLGIRDIMNDLDFNTWTSFYQNNKEKHAAHIEVGLGLAFGSLERSPTSILANLNLTLPMMVYDGIGYYYGLYKGRSTVMRHKIPEFINQNELPGFDQGLGRRLWYIAKGSPGESISLLRPFPLERHSDLWRGLGIAYGYVGDNSIENLEILLSASGAHLDSFRMGIGMAAISRYLSHSLNEDLSLICIQTCGKSLKDAILATGRFLESHQANGDFEWLKRSLENIILEDQN